MTIRGSIGSCYLPMTIRTGYLDRQCTILGYDNHRAQRAGQGSRGDTAMLWNSLPHYFLAVSWKRVCGNLQPFRRFRIPYPVRSQESKVGYLIGAAGIYLWVKVPIDGNGWPPNYCRADTRVEPPSSLLATKVESFREVTIIVSTSLSTCCLGILYKNMTVVAEFFPLLLPRNYWQRYSSSRGILSYHERMFLILS